MKSKSTILLLLFNIIIIIIILNEGALVIYNNLPSPSQQRLLVSDQLCATGQTSLLSNQSLTWDSRNRKWQKSNDPINSNNLVLPYIFFPRSRSQFP